MSRTRFFGNRKHNIRDTERSLAAPAGRLTRNAVASQRWNDRVAEMNRKGAPYVEER